MELIDRFKELYGFVFEDALVNEIVSISRVRKVKEGDVLIDIGEQIQVTITSRSNQSNERR